MLQKCYKLVSKSCCKIVLIFDCFDRFPYKFVLADYAMKKKIPLFFYGIMGYATFGYIFYPPKTACFHCLFQESKKYIVEKMGGKKGDVAVMAPTLFTASGLMVSEAVKFIVGYEEPAYNKFFMTFGKSTELEKERGIRAFRFWNTKYFNEVSKEQGFDWKKCDTSSMFLELDVKVNVSCKHCGKEKC